MPHLNVINHIYHLKMSSIYYQIYMKIINMMDVLICGHLV